MDDLLVQTFKDPDSHTSMGVRLSVAFPSAHLSRPVGAGHLTAMHYN